MFLYRALTVTALVLASGRLAAAQSRVVHVPSKILGEDRIIHVSLPPNYAVARQRYPVIYLLDGHVREFFDLTVASAGYDLTGDVHDYALPPQIVVGVDQSDRGADLSRNQEQFRRFLTEEMVPFIDHEYRTTRYRMLIGHSLGGRFALMTLCKAPGVFPAVIAISAAGADSTNADPAAGCIDAAMRADPAMMRQLVLSAGEREPRGLAGVRRLQDMLAANAPRDWRWTVVPGPGLGHTETPLATIPPGIRFVYDKSVWEMPPAVADSISAGVVNPERAIASFYAALSERVGSPVSPSLKWLLVAARVHSRAHDAEAEAAIRRVIAEYPEDLEAYGLLAELELRAGDKAEARRALTDARRMLDRLQMHDEYERARKRQLIDETLASIRP